MAIKKDNMFTKLASKVISKVKNAFYRRCSTEEQNLEGASMEAQLANAKLKARELKADDDFEIFEDPGILATKVPLKKRAGLMALLEYIEKYRPTYLFVWKRDRLARNLQEYKLVLAVTRKAETEIVYFGKGEPPVGQGAFGQFQENIIMSLIEMETIIGRGRIQDTHKEAVLSKYYLCSTPPYGYKYIPGSHRYELIPEEVEIIKKIYYLYLDEKKGYMQIAALLNDEGLKSQKGRDWHGNTVRRILTNPTYIGKRPASYVVEDERGFEKRIQTYIENDQVPVIITKEEFEAVQQLLTSRNEKRIPPRHNKTSFLFSGIIKCSKCGSKLYCHTSNQKFKKLDGTIRLSTRYYYRCRGYQYHCYGSVKKEKLEEALINEIIMKLSTLDYESVLIEAEELSKKEQVEAQMVIQGREMKVAELIARIDRNQQLLERATSPKTSYHLLSLIEKLLTEKESTENELIKARARLEQILREKFDKDKFHDDLQNWGKIFRDASTDQQREMILSVVDKVNFNVDTRDAKIYLKINPAFLHSNSCVLSNNGRCRDYIEHNNSVRVKRAIKVSIS